MTNLSDTLAALSEPAAWLHTLHMEGGQTYERLTAFQDNAFGEPGVDYSEEYTVTSEPLYRTGQLVPVPSVERVAEAIMVGKGGCEVKDWQIERRDNPHVALAWEQATAVIAAMQEEQGNG